MMPVCGWSREWQCQVDAARDVAGRLIEYANRQYAVASSWPAAAGPGTRDLSRYSEG